MPWKKCEPGCTCGLHKLTDNPHRITLHARVVKARGKAREHACAADCGRQALDWAWIHGADPLDIYGYQPMCRSCHVYYDQWGEGSEERRESQRQKLTEEWSDGTRSREEQAARCLRDEPWKGR